jgi:GH43 family beta-xylosidase
VLSCSFFFPATLPAQTNTKDGATFSNPLKDNGPDPWVFTWNGNYYYMNTTGRNLTLWKTRDITDLRNAEKKIVWTPEPGTAWSKDIWAPELYRCDDKWYIYFAADDGQNSNHRIYAVENPSADPIDGSWTFKGKVADTTDRWAIDADVFETNEQHYMLWSGWESVANGEQDIFIAHMSNPWSIDSPRTLISSPNHSWEQHGDSGGGKYVNVNEGPEALVHGNDVFVVFSGSGCWTDEYALGALRSTTSSDLLKATSWKKLPGPLLSTDASANAFGPGHNGFFKSPDGKEDWIIYHANTAPHQGCGGHRTPRIQPFTWNVDGTPNFGQPAPLDQRLPKPSSR